MKKLVLAAALTAAASTAFAGNLSAPEMEKEISMDKSIVTEAAGSSSSAGVVVPLVLLAIVAAVALD